MARWDCWTASEWKDQAHPNSERAQFWLTIILLMSSGKAKRFGPAAGTENCCCTKAPTGSSNSLPRISTPLRSVLRVILVCGGCNRSFNARTTSPVPANRSTWTKLMRRASPSYPEWTFPNQTRHILKIDGAETVENWHYLFPTDRRKRHSRDIVGDGARGA